MLTYSMISLPFRNMRMQSTKVDSSESNDIFTDTRTQRQDQLPQSQTVCLFRKAKDIAYYTNQLLTEPSIV